jgi:hypothetical protein
MAQFRSLGPGGGTNVFAVVIKETPATITNSLSGREIDQLTKVAILRGIVAGGVPASRRRRPVTGPAAGSSALLVSSGDVPGRRRTAIHPSSW